MKEPQRNPSLDAPQIDPFEAGLRWRVDLLRDLAEFGLNLMRTLDRQVALFPSSVGEASASFVAVSRAVRRTLALEAHFAAQTGMKMPMREASPPRPVPVSQRATRQKDRVRFLVEKVIRTVGDRRRVEALQLELDERLDDAAFDAGLGQQPVGLAVAGLCRQLGIVIDLSGFTAAELGLDDISPSGGNRRA